VSRKARPHLQVHQLQLAGMVVCIFFISSFSFHWYYFVTVCLLHEDLELDPMNLFLSKQQAVPQ